MIDTNDRPKKIVYYVKQWWGVAWYRAHVPGMALKQRGFDVEMTDRLDRRWSDTCDVFVTLPSCSQTTLELVRSVKQRGAISVLDIDDDYWTLHPDNPAKWSSQMLDLLASIARESSLVTTTTPELLDVMRPLNKRVSVLPNMLPDEHWTMAPRQPVATGQPLVLGWAGSTGHAPDVRMVYQVLVQLLDEYPNLEVRIAGLKEGVPQHPRLSILEPVRVEEYPMLLAGFDIAIAPLVDSRFNRCKSDLKFLEYAMLGLPVVASHVAPYARSIKHGENGYLAKNSKDWLKYLRLLINDAETRERIAKEARAFAEMRLMSGNVDRWVKAYGLDD